ncbi:MAG TPA: GtrA family protein [Mycobacteriales bacterium]|jgi:putative flippase GtrA|nr:GtrA family protein [Mycobacteriales bacterium]
MAEDRVAPVTSPVAVLVAESQDHSTARPTLRESLIRFCITGVCSLGADVGLLYGLHSGANVSLTVATIVGSIAAVLVNYTLNRNWTFQAKASHGSVIGPYLLMVGVNVGSTVGIVRGLTSLGLYYLVSKLVAVGVNTVINFISARYWVFKH